jgi:tRNA(Leu) C34 or U34 (ribose-2'-O)-methylase TrmL
MKAAVVLVDPKYPHNVGGVLRACASFDAPDLLWTGDRVSDPRSIEKAMKVSTRFPVDKKKRRWPREERMKAYNSVVWRHARSLSSALFDVRKLTPVAVEIRDGAENLVDFVHPEDAVYVFGPEDSSLGGHTLSKCHRFVRIPSMGCLNLAAAVNVVLYDRAAKEARIRRAVGDEVYFLTDHE